jgi:hypothetical protein
MCNVHMELDFVFKLGSKVLDYQSDFTLVKIWKFSIWKFEFGLHHWFFYEKKWFEKG